jgi:DNA-binding response OmpR family regulator
MCYNYRAMPERILVVEDDHTIARAIKEYLESQGFEVMTAPTGQDALILFPSVRPVLVILDLNLPKLSGLEVLQKIRKDSWVPILIVTARTEEADRVIGLEMGADDYITKPFSLRELAARVRAALRRATGEAPYPETIYAGDLVIDLQGRRVWRSQQEIVLTPTEFDLLVTLAKHPGRVFTRLSLLQAIKGYAYEGVDRTIDVHIKNLRQKIEPDAAHPRYIITVRGVGYRFAEFPKP